MDHDVIIAGGGLVGSTLALALGRARMGVALVDPVPAPERAARDFDGRAYAIANASCAMLRALGLWGAVAGEAQPILRITASDGRAGEGPSPLVLTFDHAEIEEGPMGHMIEDRHLRPALLDALDACGPVTAVAGRRIAGHAPDAAGVTVTLDDGTRRRARVLVACDGRDSPTRARAGIGRVTRRYDQASLVAAIAHEKPHGGVAHQLFLPEGPLAILPLRGERSSIVWTERAERARAIQALDDEAYLEALRPRFGDFLGAISLVGARYSYPLGLSLAHAFAAPRVALAGDSAHAVHPLAGQGLNAGLKDVAALAEVLILAARRGEDPGRLDVLRRYERWRRSDATGLAIATDGFNRLFSNDNPILRLGRDLGLGLVNALPVLRRGAMREAAGLTGDRPRLLEGKPL